MSKLLNFLGGGVVEKLGTVTDNYLHQRRSYGC